MRLLAYFPFPYAPAGMFPVSSLRLLFGMFQLSRMFAMSAMLPEFVPPSIYHHVYHRRHCRGRCSRCHGPAMGNIKPAVPIQDIISGPCAIGYRHRS